MFAKHLKRSAYSAAAVGAVLAVAATTTPGTVTAAPAIRNMSCHGSNYPANAASNTQLTLARSIQQYGQRNRANVNVTIGNDEANGGTVRISVAGQSWVVPVSGGEATHALPRRLPAGRTYDVTAVYRPACDDVDRSRATKVLTVKKAETRIPTRSARDIERGERPLVRAIVESTVSPGGEARVVITNGDARKAMTVAVEELGAGESLIRARFSRTFKRGTWDVTIRYLGTDNFEASREFADFRVG